MQLLAKLFEHCDSNVIVTLKNHTNLQQPASSNSKLITEIKDKLQVSANRGRITWLTWNLLGTLY